MRHIVFSRSGRSCKVFDAMTHSLVFSCEARNDTVGTLEYGPSFDGHFGACPAGEYTLGTARDNHTDEPDELHAEGPFFVALNDVNGLWTAQGRDEIGVHGGGSAAPEPLADRQGWYPTLGCWRMQNVDLVRFVGCTSAGDRVTVAP